MAKSKSKEPMIVPFSNGTEAMDWYDRNCENCKHAYLPKDGEYPRDKTMRQYVRDGRECPMKYALDWAFVSSELPLEMARRMGYTSGPMPHTCLKWSDRGNGGNPPGPKRPAPIAPNQMSMNFEFSEIAQNHKPLTKEVV